MSHDAPTGARHHHDAPPANKPLLAVALVLLALPVIALMLVGTYAKTEPVLWGFPFFFWYQLLWVFLCSACTYSAYVIVRRARPHRPMTRDGSQFMDATDEEAGR